jgi:ATP/maltotriose-dependent transcriptional regulator MalT
VVDGVAAEVAAGRAALLRAAWAEARAHFERALEGGEMPEALDGLGVAARSQLDEEAAFDAHERGYRLAREAGNNVLAARLAIDLAFDAAVFRGPAELQGWMERAWRLLQQVPHPTEELGIALYLRASIALNARHDPAEALKFVGSSLDLARQYNAIDGEMVCLALRGLALVAQGEVEEGMRSLDEATAAAVGGEVADARLVQTICCHMIDACKRVRDFDRAAEWCNRVEEIAKRYDDREMFAQCRVDYGELLVWRGAWAQADDALSAVCRDFARLPRTAADAVVRLAELRRRQRRFDEASALVDEVREHPRAALVRAGLALDRDNAALAAEEANRYLRRVGEPDRFERVPALELLVQARLALGDPAAEAAAAELEQLAKEAGTAPMRGAALLARGRVARRRGSPGAIEALDDAADIFSACGARYDAAQARLELAAALREEGREDAAAVAEADAARELAALGLPAPALRPAHPRDDLTSREREVLALVAQGCSNDEIAARLVLSVRTVESHVASVYGKIGVSGRTARAAATAYALTHGLG